MGIIKNFFKWKSDKKINKVDPNDVKYVHYADIDKIRDEYKAVNFSDYEYKQMKSLVSRIGGRFRFSMSGNQNTIDIRKEWFHVSFYMEKFDDEYYTIITNIHPPTEYNVQKRKEICFICDGFNSFISMLEFFANQNIEYIYLQTKDEPSINGEVPWL
jgi:hypothetical protein